MMGRMTVGSSQKRESSFSRRKSSRRLGYPINNSNEKTVKIMVGKLVSKGAFREPPLEVVTSRPGQSHICANVKILRSENVTEVNRPTYRSARLHNKFYVGTFKDLQRRKKVDSRSYLPRDKMVLSAVSMNRLEDFEPFASRGVTEGQFKEIYQESDSLLRSEDWAMGSESASSRTMLKSSSLSYKSELSSFAKRETSPASLNTFQWTSAHVCNIPLAPGALSESVAIFSPKKKDFCLLSEQNSNEIAPNGKDICRKQTLKGEFSEFNSWKGRRGRNGGLQMDSSGEMVLKDMLYGTPGYCGSLEIDNTAQSDTVGSPGPSEGDLASADFSDDEEWASGLTTPAFHSATARSPESSSEISYHSDDVANQQSLENEFLKQGRTSKPIDPHRAAVAKVGLCIDGRSVQYCSTDLKIEADDIVSADRLRRQSNVAGIQKDVGLPKLPLHDVQSGVDRGFTPSSANLRRRVLVGDCDSLGFGTKYACSLSDSLSLSQISCCDELQSTFVSMHSGDKVNLDFQIKIDDLFLQSKASSPRSISASDSLDHLHDSPVAALHHDPHDTGGDFWVCTSNQSNKLESREKLSKGSVKSSEGSLDRSPAETSELQEAMLSASRTQLDRGTKSLNPRTTPSSAVRSLEASFIGLRSDSQTQRVSPVKEGSYNKEISRPEQRDSVSPVRRWQDPVTMSKPLVQDTSVRPFKQQSLQVVDGTRNQVSLRRGAKLVMSTSKCFSPGLNSPLSHAPKLPVARSIPLFNHKNSSSDLEVSCRPFLPVSKTIQRHLLAPKAALGPGRSLSSAAKPESSVSLHSVAANISTSKMIHGCLQCAQHDGLPGYSLVLDDIEQMITARVCRTTEQGFNWMYIFHSGRHKGKGKGKGGWRNWGRKDKPISNFAGKMKVSSVVLPEVTSSGQIRHSVESEFVLFDNRVEDSAKSQSMRFESVNTTPLLSSLPPTNASAASMKSNAQFAGNAGITSMLHSNFPRQQLPQRVAHLMNERMGMDSSSSQSETSSPTKARLGHRPSFSQDVWSDSDLADSEVGPVSPCQSHMELAAVVIRMPAEEQNLPSKSIEHLTGKQTWGWGLKFLEKSSGSGTKPEAKCRVGDVPTCVDTLKGEGMPDNIAKENPSAGLNGLSPGGLDQKAFKEGNADQTCSSSSQTNKTAQEQANVTIILPVGLHGFPSGGSSGPSPLIERWRSGGKCDCGGWDLGCGLTVLSSRGIKLHNTGEIKEPGNANRIGLPSPNNPIQVFSQGNKNEVVLSLSSVQDGMLSLSFQAQLSPLYAFATAVAILHSREPWLFRETRGNGGDLSQRPPHALLKQPPILNCDNSQSEDIAISPVPGHPVPGHRREFSVHYPPDPPLSPFGRS